MKASELRNELHQLADPEIAQHSRRFFKTGPGEYDLIHKATGWMLREAGKKNPQQLEEFLNRFYRQMPRTMLRYAIEKLPEEIRKAYLKK